MYTYISTHPIFSADEIKMKNQFGTMSLSYIELLDEDTVEFFHRHVDDYEAYYVYEGSMRFHVEESEFQLEKGDFIIVGPGVFHEVVYTPLEKKQYLAFIFNIDNVTGMVQDPLFWKMVQMRMQDQKFMKGHDSKGCSDLIDSMMIEFREQEYGYKNMLQNYCQMFILRLCRNIIPNEVYLATGNNQQNLPLLITKYMHDHYMISELSLDDIARDLCISKRHAARVFSDFFGTTLSKTLMDYRIGYAMHYLMTTNHTNAWIAEAVGMNLVTLSKMFKRKTGMTMGQFRESSAQNGR